MLDAIGNNAPMILDATVAALEVIAKFLAANAVSLGALAVFVTLCWTAGRSR